MNIPWADQVLMIPIEEVPFPKTRKKGGFNAVVQGDKP